MGRLFTKYYGDYITSDDGYLWGCDSNRVHTNFQVGNFNVVDHMGGLGVEK
jgi:hypothetical protein